MVADGGQKVWWVHVNPKQCLTESQVSELLNLCAAFLGIDVQQIVLGALHSCSGGGGKKRQADNSVNFYIGSDTDGSLGTHAVSPCMIYTLFTARARRTAATSVSHAINDGSMLVSDPQLSKTLAGTATVNNLASGTRLRRVVVQSIGADVEPNAATCSDAALDWRRRRRRQ
jgi:hypothetical protein